MGTLVGINSHRGSYVGNYAVVRRESHEDERRRESGRQIRD